jgi:HEAT repeat protein
MGSMTGVLLLLAVLQATEAPPDPAMASAAVARSLLETTDIHDAIRRAASLIRDSDVLTRRAAVWVLARHARAEPAATGPSLVEATLDADAVVREWATRGLGALSPSPDIVQRVAFLLKDEDKVVRTQAVRCVAELGPAAARLAPLLLPLQTGYGADDVTKALLAIGPAAASTITEGVLAGSLSLAHACSVLEPEGDLDAISMGLSASDYHHRTAAAHCIGEIGPPASRLAAKLVSLLADRKGWVSGTAEKALSKLGPGALPALDAAEPTAPPDVRLAIQRVRKVIVGQ